MIHCLLEELRMKYEIGDIIRIINCPEASRNNGLKGTVLYIEDGYLYGDWSDEVLYPSEECDIIEKIGHEEVSERTTRLCEMSSKKDKAKDMFEGGLKEGIIHLIKIYTLLSKEEIEDILKRHKEAPEKRIAQKALARGVTEVVHGKDNAAAVENLTAVLFDKNTDFADFTADEITEFAAYLPVVSKGTALVDALCNTGLADSKKKAREFITGGAITINGTKVTEEIDLNQTAIVKKGKNKFVIVK